MARRIIWTESAWHELESAANYIAQDSPCYAAALMDEARDAARSLSRFPRRGRIVPEVGDAAIREVFVKQYRMIYEISKDGVVVLAFLHGARQFPSELT